MHYCLLKLVPGRPICQFHCAQDRNVPQLVNLSDDASLTGRSAPCRGALLGQLTPPVSRGKPRMLGVLPARGRANDHRYGQRMHPSRAAEAFVWSHCASTNKQEFSLSLSLSLSLSRSRSCFRARAPTHTHTHNRLTPPPPAPTPTLTPTRGHKPTHVHTFTCTHTHTQT